MKLSALASIMNGMHYGDDVEVVGSVEFDSRKICGGEVFLALQGERLDGHNFVDDALSRGAVATISSRPVLGPHILVDDVLLALQKWAQAHRNALPELITIGITGSQGKTTTKDFVSQILEKIGPTVSPVGSYNNDLGAPLTLLRCDPDTRFCVLEMGARHRGDILRLARMARLNVGCVLLVGTAHIGEFGSREAIAATKSEIIEELAADCVAVLGTYDEYTPSMASKTQARVLLFGEHGDITASQVTMEHGYASFILRINADEREVRLRLPGEHQVANASAAAAILTACGLGIDQIAEGLSAARSRSKWRMELIERGDGLLIINDAYNASPESVKAALRTLAELSRERGGRSWAVLGEMKELGESATAEHDAIGRLAVRLDIARLIAVGEGAKAIHMGAAHEGSWGEESMYVESIDEAFAALAPTPRDVVLIKASRSIGLEVLVDRLLETDR